MNTVEIFKNMFTARTTGPKRSFTVNQLTIDAVKIVLRNVMVKLDTDGAVDDCENGFLRKAEFSVKYYGGNNGYVPTAKGYRAILKALTA